MGVRGPTDLSTARSDTSQRVEERGSESLLGLADNGVQILQPENNVYGFVCPPREPVV